VKLIVTVRVKFLLESSEQLFIVLVLTVIYT